MVPADSSAQQHAHRKENNKESAQTPTDTGRLPPLVPVFYTIPMKLIVLDGWSLNPGDLSWDDFRQLADITVYNRTPPELVIDRITGADAILLNPVAISDAILAACPTVRYIGVLATGYNVVDTAAAQKRGVIVTNIPGYSTNAVAQHVFAFILSFASQVARHAASVQNGDWMVSKDFCYWMTPLTELNGKTLGVFGYGEIGRRVADIGRAFGMNVICTAHHPSPDIPNCVPVAELFARSDFLTLHAPLTAETAQTVNARTLALMKQGAYLINTARGALVDEQAVADALASGQLAGYACDVLTAEPMRSDCPLRDAPNCLITPHIAWAPYEARRRLMDRAVRNYAAFLHGAPENVVS